MECKRDMETIVPPSARGQGNTTTMVGMKTQPDGASAEHLLDPIRARKQQLREHARLRRGLIGNAQLEEAGPALMRESAQYVKTLAAGSTVAAYVSMGHEVPTTPTLDDWRARGLDILVPRLGSGLEIGWGYYGGSKALQAMPRTTTGGLRPAEPDGCVFGPERLARAEVILIPAFAVDSQLFRLGRGAGWYDRALLHRSPRAVLLAVCWPWEMTTQPLPRNAHDIPVDHVIRLPQPQR